MKLPISAAIALVLSSFPADAGEMHTKFAERSDKKLLAMVKASKGPVDEMDDMKCTALHYAARYGRIKTAQWLLTQKADVNTRSYNDFTPMHMVSDATLAELLIKAGADLSLKDAWNKTPLQGAAQHGHRAVCEAIIASGFPLDLGTALLLDKRDLAKKMIAENPNMVKTVTPDSDLWANTSPLGIAAGKGDKEMVELLLSAGAPVNAGTERPNAGTMTALTNAVWAGHYEIAEILCNAGADCNVTGGKFYPRLLSYAKKHASKKMVELLEKHGATEVER